MIALKLYLWYCLIAALRTTLSSASSLSRNLLFALEPGVDICSLYQNTQTSTKFQQAHVPFEYVHSSMGSETYVGNLSFDECRSEAISKDAQAFVSDGVCFLYFLRYPVCKKWKRPDFTIFIRTDYFTNGDKCDNATMNPDVLDRFGPNTRSYRIKSPTILDFEDYYVTDVSGSPSDALEYYTIIVRDNGYLGYFDRSILADPSCYTKSTCGHAFLTTLPEIPADNFLVLDKICGRNIQVDPGKSLYILSHEYIGCKFFPNAYSVAECWAEFIGTGEMKVNFTLVNFKGSDQCDTFTIKALTFDASGSSTSIDVCAPTAPTELTSAGGKVRIEFIRGANPTRQKYGFIIEATLE